jgi:hypothetical protein
MFRSAQKVVTAAVLSFAASCFYDWNAQPEPAEGGAASGGTATGGTATGGFAGTEGGVGGAGGIDPPGGGGGGTGATCASDADCASSQRFCDFKDDRCGKGEPLGTCADYDEASCSPEIAACGCSGKSYPSECDAHQSRTDVQPLEACNAIATFPCGDGLVCSVLNDVCIVQLNEQGTTCCTGDCSSCASQCPSAAGGECDRGQTGTFLKCY